MGFEIPHRFAPAEAEARIFERWERAGAFRPDRAAKGGRFVVMIPPPNVTGSLHMGHALNNTVQDVMVRFHRKSGRETLWVPGTDHAGIATQAVIEKKLFKERGVTREQLGREKFLAEVWAWKEQYGSRILEQLKRMGCSCDFSRTKFTMDPDLSAAVREAFVRLWEQGLVYRGPRLVNWDCVLQTAVGDDEIETETRRGKLWHIRYALEGAKSGGDAIVVATTRPETMLGDTAVAVHPEDERWRRLVGKRVILPLLERPIPVIADPTVARDFGTGAVKVTPGHDPDDWERGQRFGLPVISIFTDAGRVNEHGGPYRGLSREEARKRVLADLEARALVEKVVDHELAIKVSDRSGSVIEPRISEQWFVKMESLAQPAIEAVKTGALRFVPERWAKVYLDWLEHVRDWCISRQLWWGHRIPVWYDEAGAAVASRADLAIGSKHPRTGRPIVRQDDDVLDTWASSWLWPLATLGWPKEAEDLRRYYPTQFLSTAREIIYLWVARMVMSGYAFADGLARERRCPFEVCYIHATVLDAQGRRMSKSLGNGIDPLDMIEKYGADAMRFSLMLLTVEGQDIRFSEPRVEEARNFVNKLWNAARFVLQKVPPDLLAPAPAAPSTGPSSPARGAPASAAAGASDELAGATRLEDRWILARLRETLATVTDSIPACRFHEASQALRRFAWNDFCDWYVEIAKVRLEPSEDPASRRRACRIAVTVIEKLLHLLHPMAPFVTEALWSHLKSAGFLPQAAPDLITAPWPRADELPEFEKPGLAPSSFEQSLPLAVTTVVDQPTISMTATMGFLQGAASTIRNMRARNGIEESRTVPSGIRLPTRALEPALAEARPWFERLAKTTLLGFGPDFARPPDSDADVFTEPSIGPAEIYMPLSGLIDKDARRKDLRTRIEKARHNLTAIQSKLANEGFLRGAPADVVKRERARAAQLDAEIARLLSALDSLGA